MDELYIGLAVVVLGVFTIRTMNTYHNYKNTIYPQIYSGFFEFLYRKASAKRLSTSSCSIYHKGSKPESPLSQWTCKSFRTGSGEQSE